MKGRVAWVVDGDTIHGRIGKHRERVRDIGVDAPEIPHAVRGGLRRVRPRPGRRDPAAPGA
jgi:endonuclease YncB( thermonuclease family)